MDRKKRLWALMLVILLICSVIVPVVYGDGEDVAQSQTSAIPVAPEIACQDMIQTVRCEIAATDEVNGQDYLYLLFKGNIMLVYNLDTGELIDKRTDVFTTPVDIYIDENNIVWVCGSTRKLYRYDPRTKEGTSISIQSALFPVTTNWSVYGISGDGKGNLYFGTYDTTYLGKYDTKTGAFSRLGGQLSTGATKDPDGIYSGKGGIFLKDGYAYLTINGNKNGDSHYSHEIIKFDLENETIVDYIDYSHLMSSSKKMPDYMTLIGGKYLIGSTDEATTGTVIVDISGEKMKLVKLEGLTGIKGAVSDEIDGNVYFMSQGNKGLMYMNVATGKVYSAGIANNDILACRHGGAVTIDGVPGKSLLTFKSASGSDTVDISFYHVATGKSETIRDYTKGVGSANQLRSIALSEDGKIIYVGAYGTPKVSGYDIITGEKVHEFYTTGQNDSLLWYDGYLYTGIYSYCSIGQYIPETGAGRVLSRIYKTGFFQNRVHAIAAGDGMVFVGTVPGAGRLGGSLMWYNIEEKRIYVTVGPEKTDVYYTYAGNLKTKDWYSAVTGALADSVLDVNNDGAVDNDDGFMIVDGVQVPVYTGVIENQSINNLIYKDGYLIGSTTRYGGSGSTPENANAVLFVYNVETMELLTTCDVTEFISGLTTPVNFIDAIAEDPEIEGKFWGIVSDTLFSFNVDLQEQMISQVQEELSFGKSAYTHGGNNWDSRDILFDGDFMYAVFGQNGTYMIDRNNVQNYVKLSSAVPKQMVQAADGNLYYIENKTDLKVLKIAQAAQQIMDDNALSKAMAMIAALPDKNAITLSDEAAVLMAREAYDKLPDKTKLQISNYNKLTEAEDAFERLRNEAQLKKILVPVGIVVVVAAAAVVAVVVLKKKKKQS